MLFDLQQGAGKKFSAPYFSQLKGGKELGFYYYFNLAKKYCPRSLRGFEPALDYEIARIFQSWEYVDDPHDSCFVEWATRYAYDNIVERIGDEIAASHLQPTEEYVCIRNR